MRLSKAFPDATYDYTDASNAVVGGIVSKLEALFDSTNGDDIGLASFCEKSLSTIGAKLEDPYNKRPYFTALAIQVFYEKI